MARPLKHQGHTPPRVAMVQPMSTVDPLLFELVDLAQLAFPRPVASAEAVFGGDAGPRRALVDLSGTADPGALSHDPLAAVAAALVALRRDDERPVETPWV